jgi:ADP-heptose:LPS heptosyltransferase
MRLLAIVPSRPYCGRLTWRRARRAGPRGEPGFPPRFSGEGGLKHVLVTRLDSAGDVLLAGPAIRAVAHRADRVILVHGPRGAAAAALLPCVDELIEFQAPWIDPQPDPVDTAAVDAFVDEVMALGVDEAIIFGSYHQSPLPTALLLRLAGVPRLGAVCEDYPGALLDVRHRPPDDLHEVERNLSLAEAMGYRLPEGDDGRLRIERPGRLPERLAAHRPYVAVHPGASVPARAWPAERHAELVELLVAAGHRVVLTGGPDEAELTARVAGPDRPQVVDLGGKIDLAGCAEVLAAADALVVANTGPAHLAAAVGCAVVSLFAPTVPAIRWRPWGVPLELLGDQEAPCAGTRATQCTVPGHPCLSDVSAGEAFEAVQRLAPQRLVEAAS